MGGAMTTSGLVLGFLTGAGATIAVSEVGDTGPWLLAALGAMGGFIGLMFKWLTSRQDALHVENRARDERRENREDKRQDSLEKMVLLMATATEKLCQIDERTRESDDDRRDVVRQVMGAIGAVRDIVEQARAASVAARDAAAASVTEIKALPPKVVLAIDAAEKKKGRTA